MSGFHGDIAPSEKDLRDPSEATTADEKTSAEDSLRDRVRVKSGDNIELAEDNSTLVIKQAISFSNAGKRAKSDYQPTKEELSVINEKYSNTQLSPLDIFVYTLESADQQVDRQNEKFSQTALETMARLSLDKAFLIDHNWTTDNNIGKIFAAEAANGKLYQKVYVLNDPMNDRVNKNIMAGIFNKVSVGFSASVHDMQCSSCVGSVSIYDSACPHMPGAMDDAGQKTFVDIADVSDYFEVSLVPIPAQRDAGIRRRSVEQVKGVLAEEESLSAVNPITGAGRRSMTITPEMIESWERDSKQIIAISEIDNSEKSENIDTIMSDIHSGDELVSKPTTLASTETGTAKPSTVQSPESKTADVFTADMPATIEPINLEVEGQAGDTDSDDLATANDPAAVEQKAPEESVAPEVVAAEEVVVAPEVVAPEAAPEEVATPDVPAEDAETKAVEVEVTKTFHKAVEDLRGLVDALASLLESQKSLAAATQQIELAMQAQDSRLKTLTDIVEAATRVTVESIEREMAAKAVSKTTGTNNGTQWAADLTKKLMGGNQ